MKQKIKKSTIIILSAFVTLVYVGFYGKSYYAEKTRAELENQVQIRVQEVEVRPEARKPYKVTLEWLYPEESEFYKEGRKNGYYYFNKHLPDDTFIFFRPLNREYIWLENIGFITFLVAKIPKYEQQGTFVSTFETREEMDELVERLTNPETWKRQSELIQEEKERQEQLLKDQQEFKTD